MAIFFWPPASAAASAVNISDSAGGSITVGQKAMAASLPVVIASDQSAVPVSLSSSPLPTGAATEITLAAASAKLPATLGQKAMAASLAVVLASDQSAVPVTGTFFQATQPVSATALPLPAGAATETTLAAASAKLPATLGQKAMTASLAVVIASDQGAVPTSAPVNSNGSIINQALSATTASSTSAPANTVGFVIQAPSTNTDNIRWCVGGTASTTVGMLMEPGRDSGFYPMAAAVSVCATVSGTNAYSIQWVKSS